MTRAPLVMGKAQEAFQRSAEIDDTTIGWRFINPLMKKQYGVDAMPETGENVAEDYQVGAQGPGRVRAALAAARRQGAGVGLLRRGDRAGDRAGRQGRAGHRRQGRASAAGHDDGGARQAQDRSCAIPARVTAGNASGVNDGAAAMIIASEAAVKKHGLTPRARITRHGVGRRAAARHGHRPGAVDPEADGAARAEDRRLRRDRAERGVRLAGAGLPAPARACPTTPSTSIRTAARSRSAIRSACRARGLRSPRLHQHGEAAAASARSPPCASASGRACRSRSSACELHRREAPSRRCIRLRERALRRMKRQETPTCR